MKVIGVKFKSTNKIYYFNPNGFEIEKNDCVIVETSRGTEFGQVVIGIKDIPENEIVQPLQNVVRLATEQDKRNIRENAEKQKDAFEKCKSKIEEHKLNMKLVDAEYAFDGSKLIFYFTSEERVDFRDLVKELATMFKTRIELRQIAVRDETKMLGGLGACGNEICCKRFLADFQSVSIKMAKEQCLSLNPTKISGLCGRLICCLNYEKDFYDDMNKKLPSTGEAVMSPKGKAEIIATYPLKESVRVKYTNPDGSTDSATYHIEDITRLDPNAPNTAEPVEDDKASLVEDSIMNPKESQKDSQKNRREQHNKNNRHDKKLHQVKPSQTQKADLEAGADKNEQPKEQHQKHKKHDSNHPKPEGNKQPTANSGDANAANPVKPHQPKHNKPVKPQEPKPEAQESEANEGNRHKQHHRRHRGNQKTHINNTNAPEGQKSE